MRMGLSLGVGAWGFFLSHQEYSGNKLLAVGERVLLVPRGVIISGDKWETQCKMVMASLMRRIPTMPEICHKLRSTATDIVEVIADAKIIAHGLDSAM